LSMIGVITFSAGGVPLQVMTPVMSAACVAGKNANVAINRNNDEVFIFWTSNLTL
jgi:hypothetical protein